MLSPKQLGIVEALTDLPTGGAIATTQRIDRHRAITVNQTTAGQALTLPSPTDASIVYGIDVLNVGSAAFTMYGVTVSASAAARYFWNGTAWVPDVAPTATSEIIEALIPTALNTVPNLANAPAAGSTVKFFVNDGFVSNAGVTADAAGAVTVASATLGYNVATTDVVTAIYSV